jgi:hypothetical protein
MCSWNAVSDGGQRGACRIDIGPYSRKGKRKRTVLELILQVIAALLAVLMTTLLI